MRAKTPLLVALLLLTLIFFSFTVNGYYIEDKIEPTGGESDLVKVTVDPAAEGDWTPGTTIDLPSPADYYGGGRYGAPIEPMAYYWVVYDPTNHVIYEETHAPTSKYYSEELYMWVFGDIFSFQIPAFARGGEWVALGYIQYEGDIEEYADGWRFPVADEGLFTFANFFEAPLYVFNIKLPALFWCLSVIWIPLLIMLMIYIYARSAEGVADVFASARDAGRRAREKWRQKKELKARQQQ